MKHKKLNITLALLVVCVWSIAAGTPLLNLQKNQTTNALTASFTVPAGLAVTVASSGGLTANSGSTVTLNGALAGTPSGTVDMSGVTFSGTPSNVATLTGTQSLSSKKVSLAAGSATAGTAPVKYASGTKMTTAEAGAVEYDGTHKITAVNLNRYGLGGRIANISAGGDASGSAAVLTSLSLPANTLTENGQAATFRLAGSIENSGAGYQLQARFNSVTAADTGSFSAATAQGYVAEVTVIRQSNTTALVTGRLLLNGVAGSIGSALSSPINLTTTAYTFDLYMVTAPSNVIYDWADIIYQP